MINYELDGKVAVITGGASGIGLACAHAIARSGAAVCLWDLKADPLAAAWRLTLCGLTRADVMGLRWTDVDLEEGTATVRTGRVVLDSGRAERHPRACHAEPERHPGLPGP